MHENHSTTTLEISEVPILAKGIILPVSNAFIQAVGGGNSFIVPIKSLKIMLKSMGFGNAQ